VPAALRGITPARDAGARLAVELWIRDWCSGAQLIRPGLPAGCHTPGARADAIVSIEYYWKLWADGRTDPCYRLEKPRRMCIKTLAAKRRLAFRTSASRASTPPRRSSSIRRIHCRWSERNGPCGDAPLIAVPTVTATPIHSNCSSMKPRKDRIDSDRCPSIKIPCFGRLASCSQFPTNARHGRMVAHSRSHDLLGDREFANRISTTLSHAE